MISRSLINYEELQYTIQILLIYTAHYVALALSSYLLVQCGKQAGKKKGDRVSAGKRTSSIAAVSSTDKPAADEKSKELGKEVKGEEKLEKKEPVNQAEVNDEGRKNDLKEGTQTKDDNKKENSAEKEEEKKEEKKKVELKPKQIKRNEKEERIAQGKEVRNKGDYPTFNDVESDWDSDKEKKNKKEKENSKRSEKNKGDDKEKLASVKKTQSLSRNTTPLPVTVEPAQTKVSARGGKWTQQINNRSDKKIVFKIRCTNNSEYRVSPVFGFVDAAGNATIEVNRLKGAPKEDKIVIQYAVAPAGVTDAQTAFAHIQPTENFTVNIVAS